MRIALLTELFYPHMAGCERRFFEIGKRLAQRGHEVHVFALQHEASLPKEETIEGIFVHRCTYASNYIKPARASFRSLGGILKYSFATSMRLLAEDFDIYYSNQWPIIHSIFAKPFASPLVQEWCEVWIDSRKMMMMQRILKLMGDQHVAVSEFTRHRLVSLLKMRQEKLFVIPNGVDYLKFSEGSTTKMLGRIIYVGRLVPHKHVEMLYDVFRQVKEKTREAELHIVGSGLSSSSIKNWASRLDDCFIHGFLPEDEMLNILRSSSLFIFPSEREGSGIVALEAMAAGTPVITVDFPDNATKELVNGMNGLVVPPNVDALAKAVLTLLDDESRWCEMSTYARSFAKHYDWEVIVTKLEEVFMKVAG